MPSLAKVMHDLADRAAFLEARNMELERNTADYALLVSALQSMTRWLSSTYAGDEADMNSAHEHGVGKEIRNAATILMHAAPPLRPWAEAMLNQWKSPIKKKGRGK